MVKEATSAVAVFTFLTLRFGVAAIVLAVAARSVLRRLDRRAAAISVVAGLCFAAGYGFQTIGLQTIGPGRTGFVAGLTVVIVPIGAAILWRRRPNISAFIGIASAVLGLALLTGGLNGEPPTTGDAWVLLGALWFAGQVLAISTLPRRSDPRALAAVQVVTMAIACAVIAAFTEQADLADGRARVGRGVVHRADRHSAGRHRADLGAGLHLAHPRGPHLYNRAGVCRVDRFSRHRRTIVGRADSSAGR